MVRQSIYHQVTFSFYPLGDHALIIKANNFDHIRKITPHIQKIIKNIPIIDIMATLESIVIIYDAMQCDFATICDIGENILYELHEKAHHPYQRNIYKLPIYYNNGDIGEYTQDFKFLCNHLSLSPTQLIANHTSQHAEVLMIGFQPGFLHAGMMSDEWNIPRATKIKPKVRAGTVCVAICQSVITTIDTPTGWHVIGQTPFLNFSLNHNPPIMIKAGDIIQYQSINYHDFVTLKAKFANGEISLESMINDKS